MNYMAFAGAVAVYKAAVATGVGSLSAAYGSAGIWGLAKSAASSFYGGAVGALETIGSYATTAYNAIVGTTAGTSAATISGAAYSGAINPATVQSLEQITAIADTYGVGGTILGIGTSGTVALNTVAGSYMLTSAVVGGAGAAASPAALAAFDASVGLTAAASTGATAGSTGIWASATADPTGTALVVVAAIVVADQILSDPDKKNVKDFITNPTDTVAKWAGW